MTPPGIARTPLATIASASASRLVVTSPLVLRLRLQERGVVAGGEHGIAAADEPHLVDGPSSAGPADATTRVWKVRVRAEHRERGRGDEELLGGRADERRVGAVGGERVVARVHHEAGAVTGRGGVERRLEVLGSDRLHDRLGNAAYRPERSGDGRAAGSPGRRFPELPPVNATTSATTAATIRAPATSARPRIRRPHQTRGLASGPVLVAQHALEQLARLGARQLVAQLVLARALVAADALVDERAQLVEVDGLARLRLHDRVHALAPFVVGDAEHRDVEDRGVLVDHRLDLGRVDVDPAGDDHVLLAVADVEVALVVEVRDVADRLPLRAVLGELLVGVVVAVHRERRADEQLAPLARGRVGAVVAHDAHLDRPYVLPHEPGLRSWSSGLSTVTTPSSVEP